MMIFLLVAIVYMLQVKRNEAKIVEAQNRVRCHALEFQHTHVRESPDYSLFCAKFPKAVKRSEARR